MKGGACIPVRVHTIVISVQHSEAVTMRDLRQDLMEKVIATVIPAQYLDDRTVYHLQPSGKFVIGGPQVRRIRVGKRGLETRIRICKWSMYLCMINNFTATTVCVIKQVSLILLCHLFTIAFFITVRHNLTNHSELSSSSRFFVPRPFLFCHFNYPTFFFFPYVYFVDTSDRSLLSPNHFYFLPHSIVFVTGLCHLVSPSLLVSCSSTSSGYSATHFTLYSIFLHFCVHATKMTGLCCAVT